MSEAPPSIEPLSTPDAARSAVRAGVCVLILMTAVAYGPTLGGGFIWDDDTYVTNNPLLVAPDGLWKIWFDPLRSPSQYFPLVYTMFRFEFAAFGFHPLGYKVVNLLLHVTNALLVWRILHRLNIPGAWTAATLFAVHPIQLESVAWITERKNTLSTVFYLTSALAWINWLDDERRRERFYGLSFALYALALFAKTTACTLPAGLLLIVWLRGDRPLSPKWIGRVLPFVAWGVLMGALSIWIEHAKQGTRDPDMVLPVLWRVLIAGRALWFYVGKILWPATVCFSYPKWPIDPRDVTQYVWPVACVVVGAALWAGRRRLPRVVAGLTLYAASLFPLVGFFALYTFLYTYVADHYAYVAGIGVFAVMGAGAACEGRSKLTRGALRYGITPITLVVLTGLTWRAGFAYRNAETLWLDVLAKNPESWLAHHNYGVILAQRHDLAHADEEYAVALRLHPGFALALGNRGTVALMEGRRADAIAWYRRAIAQTEARPTNPAEDAEAYVHLAFILADKGESDEAIELFRRALTLQPEHVDALLGLAKLYAQRGDAPRAAACYERVLRIQPSNAAAQVQLHAATGGRTVAP